MKNESQEKSGPPPGSAPGDGPAPTDVRLAAGLVCSLLFQLVFGALLRHTHAAWALYTHVIFAGLVFMLMMACGLRAIVFYAEHRPISRLGRTLTWLGGGQVALGVAALVMTINVPAGHPPGTAEVLITTAHQTTGAVLMAVSVALGVWHMGLLSAGRSAFPGRLVRA